MSEYTIKSLVNSEPREWKGPHGVVYYIEVELEGHDKIVSIGKKAPDALKQGDTVYGDIIETDYIADKFKPSPPPENSPQSFSSPDNKYLKDTSDMPYRVWKDMLPYMDVQALIKDKTYNEALNQYVIEQSNELLKLIENVRGDDIPPTTSTN